MKSVLYLFLILFSTSSSAQCPAMIYADLDSGSIVREQINWFGFHRDYLDFPNLIKIDTVTGNNQWQIGHPQKAIFDSAFSYPIAILTDTIHPCLPSDTSVFTMHVPLLGMGLCYFSFHYRLDIDSGDIALLEWSGDTGLHWSNVFTDSSHSFYFPNGIPDWTISTAEWDSVNINCSVSGWTDSFLFKFTFISDSDSSARDGWMIDNFSFGYYAEGVQQLKNKQFLNIYPNPGITTISISASYRIHAIAISNLIGQTVYNQQNNSSQAQIDVSALPAGIYLIRINETEVRKFVKE